MNAPPRQERFLDPADVVIHLGRLASGHHREQEDVRCKACGVAVYGFGRPQASIDNGWVETKIGDYCVACFAEAFAEDDDPCCTFPLDEIP